MPNYYRVTFCFITYRASIHWDIVNMMILEYNGGRIIIDGKLIQENGIFIPKSLQSLNKVKN